LDIAERAKEEKIPEYQAILDITENFPSNNIVRIKNMPIRNIFPIRIILSLLVLGVLFYPAHRYYLQNQIIGDPVNYLRASQHPKYIHLQKLKKNGINHYDIGYSAFDYNKDINIEISYDGPFTIINSKTIKMGILDPKEPEIFHLSDLKPMNLDQVAAKLESLEKEKREKKRISFDPFERDLEIINTLPKSFFEILLMSSDKFSNYLSNLAFKTLNRFGSDGIFIYGNGNIRGIIYLGEYNKGSDQAYVTILPKKAYFGQAFHAVRMPEAQKSLKNLILPLLSNYQFKITEVKSRDFIISLKEKAGLLNRNEEILTNP